MAATVQIIDSKQTGPNGFEGYTVRDLKAHLRERGCHVSGTKAELIKRAMGLRVLSERQFSNTDLEQTEDKVEQDSRKQEAREGECCNHVSTLLYAFFDMSEKKEKGLNASTSKKNKWMEPRRKLSPVKSQNLIFKKYKTQERSTENKLSSSTTTNY
ncbi:uncharacterized protein [Haliotis asinina]|uniref:uncharacterized protein isoform X1 n=1 Tax=Haliotis asinina TaxID=109174 RepID=UPI0035321FCB